MRSCGEAGAVFGLAMRFVLGCRRPGAPPEAERLVGFEDFPAALEGLEARTRVGLFVPICIAESVVCPASLIGKLISSPSWITSPSPLARKVLRSSTRA